MAALAERNPTDAEAALVALGDGTFGTNWIQLNHRFAEGLVVRMTKDDARAHAAFTAARVEQEKVVKAQPDYGPAWCGSDSSTPGWEKRGGAARRPSCHRVITHGEGCRQRLAHDRVLGRHRGVVGKKDLRANSWRKRTRGPGGWLVSYGQLKLSPSGILSVVIRGSKKSSPHSRQMISKKSTTCRLETRRDPFVIGQSENAHRRRSALNRIRRTLLDRIVEQLAFARSRKNLSPKEFCCRQNFFPKLRPANLGKGR